MFAHSTCLPKAEEPTSKVWLRSPRSVALAGPAGTSYARNKYRLRKPRESRQRPILPGLRRSIRAQAPASSVTNNFATDRWTLEEQGPTFWCMFERT